MASTRRGAGDCFCLAPGNREDRRPAGRAARRSRRPARPDAVRHVLRRRMAAARAARFCLATGVEALDRALGGGLPQAALTEIHGAETRDAGAVAGFALALVSLLLKGQQDAGLPLLWIGTVGDFPRGRLPLCARARARFSASRPSAAVLARRRSLPTRCGSPRRPPASRRSPACVLELRGNPAQARPHRDAAAAPPRPGGRPAGLPAAPGGLCRADRRARPPCPVGRRPPAPRDTLAGPLPGSIGPPGLHRHHRQEPHRAARRNSSLEWNRHERRLSGKTAQNPGACGFPISAPERILRQRLGRSWRSRLPQSQPPLVISHRDSEHAAHRRARRAG